MQVFYASSYLMQDGDIYHFELHGRKVEFRPWKISQILPCVIYNEGTGWRTTMYRQKFCHNLF